MIASVNHGGDSDSTGAVTGNILGAAIGYEAIPQFFKDDLELHDVILHMADDLYRGEPRTAQILDQVIFSLMTPFVPRQDRASRRMAKSLV